MLVTPAPSAPPAGPKDLARDGLVGPVPVFRGDARTVLQERCRDFLTRWPAWRHETFGWERAGGFLLDVATHPAILDLVEPYLGPDFLLFATQVVRKPPGQHKGIVPHQDTYFYPLAFAPWTCVPLGATRNLAVRLAIDANTRANGAMRYLPGSHRHGLRAHVSNERHDEVGSMGLCLSAEERERGQTVCLDAGDVSLHHDTLVHWSGPNSTQGERTVIVLRYMRTDVACDLTRWPRFRARLVRGRDAHGLNPTWERPYGWWEVVGPQLQAPYLQVWASDARSAVRHYTRRFARALGR